MLPYIITAVVSVIITALIVWFAAALYQKKSANSKIGNAEEKARGIIDEAVKTAEEKKRESMLEIKEESIKAKNDLDKEIKVRTFWIYAFVDNKVFAVFLMSQRVIAVRAFEGVGL